uniref:Uncharacterized protein n=1 Tax=Globisporangium ultimum (strain ATCC 200006 / CBS 805.95 / DAOM BR144) TaxID=431595 RepID=K3X344_GLOUD
MTDQRLRPQLYQPLHGGPPVAIRDTPPRKAKSPRPPVTVSTRPLSAGRARLVVAPPLAAAIAQKKEMAPLVVATAATPVTSIAIETTGSSQPTTRAASPAPPLRTNTPTTTLRLTQRAKAGEPVLPPQVMEPYDGVLGKTLREECSRRGLSIWGDTRKDARTKVGLMRLLREDDQRRAAADASARMHEQDLEQVQLGGYAHASPTSARSAAATSFLSPNSSMPTPANVAAASAGVLYLPTADDGPPTASPPAPMTENKPPPATKAKAKSKAKVPAGATPSSGAKPSKTLPKSGPKGPNSPVRSVRPRRSCRFRLINVLLSPDFNIRWHEMNDKIAESDKDADVNQFWLDIHVAFMSVNQLFDALHFHDALFVSIDPSVILGHEATRLRQMWHEIVSMYQRAVINSRQTAQGEDDKTQSFFDSCSGRLDLLYLHMGLLLEPQLSEFVMSMDTKGPFGSQRASAAKNAKVTAVNTSRNQKGNAASGAKSKATEAVASTTGGPAVKTMKKASNAAGSKPNASVLKAVTPPKAKKASSTLSPAAAAQGNTSGFFKPAYLNNKSQVPPVQPEVAHDDVIPSNALVVSGEVRDSAFETFAPSVLRDDDSGSSDYDAEIPTRAITPKKRRRFDASGDIVEMPSRRSDLMHHPAKRMHTAMTTTMPSGLMLPPDEWDILENRLRKVNESLDRCHRALSGIDGEVPDLYRMSLESDLRFYSAIKQRLQEQLLMVMQGY